MIIRMELYSGMSIKEADFQECFDKEDAIRLFQEFVKKMQEEKKKGRGKKK